MSRFAFAAVLLVGFCAGLYGVARGDDASVDEEVERWVTILREYARELPMPGPISAERARLKRQILNAPLEELYPRIRTGIALQQLDIRYRDGDWNGVQQLKARILDSENWPRSDLDALPLDRIADFYSSHHFPPPGGMAAGQDIDTFRDVAGAYWRANIQDYTAEKELIQTILRETNPSFVKTRSLIYYLIYLEGASRDKERVNELVLLYGIPPTTEAFGLEHYDMYGRHWAADEFLERQRRGLERLRANAQDWAHWAEGRRERMPNDPWYYDRGEASTSPTTTSVSHLTPTPFAVTYARPVTDPEEIARLRAANASTDRRLREMGYYGPDVPSQDGIGWLAGWRLGVLIAGVCSLLAVLVAAVVILRRIRAR